MGVAVLTSKCRHLHHNICRSHWVRGKLDSVIEACLAFWQPLSMHGRRGPNVLREVSVTECINSQCANCLSTYTLLHHYLVHFTTHTLYVHCNCNNSCIKRHNRHHNSEIYMYIPPTKNTRRGI